MSDVVTPPALIDPVTAACAEAPVGVYTEERVLPAGLNVMRYVPPVT
jgi:hypothetical protein